MGTVIAFSIALAGWLPPAPADTLPRTFQPVASWDVSVEEAATTSFGRCDLGPHTTIIIRHAGDAAGTRLFDLVEEADIVRLRYTPGAIQTGLRLYESEAEREADEQRLDRLYSFRLTFVVIPALGKPVVVEEDTSGLLAGPRVWVERARLQRSGVK